MALYDMDIDGSVTVTATVGVVASASDVSYILLNNTDGTLDITLTASNNTSITVTEGLNHKVPPKSYIFLTVNNSTASAENLGVTTITNTHRTSAQNGEQVFLGLYS